MSRVLLQNVKSLCFVKTTPAPVRWLHSSNRLFNKRQKPDTSHIPELNEPPFKKYYEVYYQPTLGRVHDKKPFKLKCEKGKIYYWCVCGWSHDQPLCDGRCIYPEMKIKLRPVVFKPRETKEYWLCNCKQTKNRPFCDGTHNSDYVQASQAVIKHGKKKKTEENM